MHALRHVYRKQLMETWPVNTYNSQEFGILTAVIIWPHAHAAFCVFSERTH